MSNQTTEEQLLDIIGHLGTAIVQSIPSDDAIIMGHVRDAHEIALRLHRSIGISALAEESRQHLRLVQSDGRAA